jgi:dTDP-4-dehydrorhamnose 3,5-epimerase
MSESKFKKTEIDEVEGAFLIKRPVHRDDRGDFCELFRHDNHKVFPVCMQENHSFSYGGTLRGMHLQRDRPQGKLITCLYGIIHDVIFDLRPDSSTYLQGFSFELDFKSLRTLYCPPGCAHGFVTLSQFAVVHYGCTTTYDPDSDGGINYKDERLSHLWPDRMIPTLSQKDRLLPTVDEYREKYLKGYESHAEQ